MIRHYIHSHLQKSCKICPKVFPDIRALAQNIANIADHFNEPDHKCEHCGKHFIELYKMKLHVQTVYFNQHPYQCDKCEKSFQTRRGLKDNIRVHHEEQVEVECQKYEKKFGFGNEIHLRAHYQQSHRTQNNSFVCDSCGKSFKLKQSLKMHCLSEHANVEDQEKYKIQCHHTGCNFASLQKRAVEEHFERIHLKLKKFLCSHCPKSFYNKMRLDEHTIGVHMNKKPFKCEL